MSTRRTPVARTQGNAIVQYEAKTVETSMLNPTTNRYRRGPDRRVVTVYVVIEGRTIILWEDK